MPVEVSATTVGGNTGVGIDVVQPHRIRADMVKGMSVEYRIGIAINHVVDRIPAA